jgi:hypothetical protein
MDEIVSSIEVSQDLAAWFSFFLLWVVSFSSFCGLVQNFSIPAISFSLLSLFEILSYAKCFDCSLFFCERSSRIGVGYYAIYVSTARLVPRNI